MEEGIAVALVAGIEKVVARQTGRGVGASCVRSGLLSLVVTRSRPPPKGSGPCQPMGC